MIRYCHEVKEIHAFCLMLLIQKGKGSQTETCKQQLNVQRKAIWQIAIKTIDR